MLLGLAGAAFGFCGGGASGSSAIVTEDARLRGAAVMRGIDFSDAAAASAEPLVCFAARTRGAAGAETAGAAAGRVRNMEIAKQKKFRLRQNPDTGSGSRSMEEAIETFLDAFAQVALHHIDTLGAIVHLWASECNDPAMSVRQNIRHILRIFVFEPIMFYIDDANIYFFDRVHHPKLAIPRAILAPEIDEMVSIMQKPTMKVFEVGKQAIFTRRAMQELGPCRYNHVFDTGKVRHNLCTALCDAVLTTSAIHGNQYFYGLASRIYLAIRELIDEADARSSPVGAWLQNLAEFYIDPEQLYRVVGGIVYVRSFVVAPPPDEVTEKKEF